MNYNKIAKLSHNQTRSQLLLRHSTTQQIVWCLSKHSLSKSFQIWLSCSELQAKVTASGKAVEEPFEDKAEKINELFVDKIVPFYREVIQMQLTAEFDELLIDFKAQEQKQRNHVAE